MQNSFRLIVSRMSKGYVTCSYLTGTLNQEFISLFAGRGLCLRFRTACLSTEISQLQLPGKLLDKNCILC